MWKKVAFFLLCSHPYGLSNKMYINSQLYGRSLVFGQIMVRVCHLNWIASIQRRYITLHNTLPYLRIGIEILIQKSFGRLHYIRTKHAHFSYFIFTLACRFIVHNKATAFIQIDLFTRKSFRTVKKFDDFSNNKSSSIYLHWNDLPKRNAQNVMQPNTHFKGNKPGLSDFTLSALNKKRQIKWYVVSLVCYLSFKLSNPLHGCTWATKCK